MKNFGEPTDLLLAPRLEPLPGMEWHVNERASQIKLRNALRV